MHHAPPGPPLLARIRFRMAGVLGPLGVVVVVLRRMRLLPLSLLCLALAAFGMAAPLTTPDDDPGSTAALAVPTEAQQGLVPATGDGWTQDGAPAETSRSQRSSESPKGPAASSVAGTPSAAAVSTTREPAPEAHTRSSTGSSTASSSAAARSSSTPPGSSNSSPPPSPVETPEGQTAPADPAAQALAAIGAARTEAGCAVLSADGGLAALAAGHSETMRDTGPAVPDLGSGIVVVANGTDPEAVVAGWLADADDREALLDCGLTRAGVATVDGWWTLVAA